MICASAAARLRLVSAGEKGAEQPESVARTAQMITLPKGKPGVCAGEFAAEAQSPRGAAAS
jgi:hypothetical protein